jgi:hypothetical protein
VQVSTVSIASRTSSGMSLTTRALTQQPFTSEDLRRWADPIATPASSGGPKSMLVEVRGLGRFAVRV